MLSRMRWLSPLSAVAGRLAVPAFPWRVAALTLSVLALALALASAASGQTDQDFKTIRAWDAGDGARTEAVLDTLRLVAGSIHSPQSYSDFVFRFEYRPTTIDDGAALLVRTSGFHEGVFHTYAVTLDAGVERGRLAAERQVLHDTGFTARPASAGGAWIPCEVRAEGDRLTVSIDGVIVSTAKVDELSGTIGFRAGTGTIELRGLAVAAIINPKTIDPALPKADAPGVTPPKATHRTHPRYTRAAMDAKAQGVAELEFVIEADGRLGAVRVKKAPHPDLAETSIACLRQWRFRPALKDGAPIAVVATMELSFKLK
jgi:TonB family protein